MNQRLEEIRAAVAPDIPEIQKYRSDVQLSAFVVGAHDATPRQWQQAVLEMQVAIDAIDEAVVRQRQIERKIMEWSSLGTAEGDDEAELLRIAHRRQAHAMLGKMRELETLYALYRSMPRFTREQIEAAEVDYWRARIMRQAIHGILATGRIGVGELDALHQLGVTVEEVIERVKPRLESINRALAELPNVSTAAPALSGPAAQG